MYGNNGYDPIQNGIDMPNADYSPGAPEHPGTGQSSGAGTPVNADGGYCPNQGATVGSDRGHSTGGGLPEGCNIGYSYGTNSCEGGVPYPSGQNGQDSGSAGYDASELYGQPLYPIQTAPRYAQQTYSAPYTQSAPPTAKKPSRKKRRSKVPLYMAGIAAVLVLSAAAGGGAAWVVVSNANLTQEEAAPVVETYQSQPVTTDSTAIPAVAGEGTSSSVISAVAKKATGSVVEISTEVVAHSPFTGQYVTDGAGSGVVLTEDGYIVTNNHVIEGASNVTVRTEDGTEYSATLVGTDVKTDLAVIKVEAGGLSPVSFADSDNIEVGNLAVAIGNPLGELGGTVTDGIISAKDRDITIGGETMTLLQTSAAVNPGNSGGGLFNENGDLIGIVNAKSSGTDIEGLGFAIPSNTVKEVVDEIIQNGYVSGRPQLGISVVEIADEQTAFAYRVNGLGVYVATTTVDNGLMTGDRLVSIDGTEIASTGDISAVLKNHAVGDTLSVVVDRDNREVSVDVTLTEQVPQED